MPLWDKGSYLKPEMPEQVNWRDNQHFVMVNDSVLLQYNTQTKEQSKICPVSEFSNSTAGCRLLKLSEGSPGFRLSIQRKSGSCCKINWLFSISRASMSIKPSAILGNAENHGFLHRKFDTCLYRKKTTCSLPEIRAFSR